MVVSSDTTDLLSPIEPPKKSSSKYFRWVAAKKKNKFSIVEIEKTAMILQAMGKALLRNSGLSHDGPLSPSASGHADDFGRSEGGEAVHECDAELDFCGLAVGGEPLERHWSE